MSGAERYDTLIIGAGMSGLAAGIRLAQFDRRVAILEKHYLWGGLNSFYKLGGRRFDVGLHALTNYVPKGTRGTPLARVLRQLRITHDELRLGEQRFSEIVFPGLRLRFTNDFEVLRQQVHEAFPAERDGFESLLCAVRATDIGDEGPSRDSRAVLAEHIGDPLLRDALMLPMAYYGSASEGGPDWTLFCILFQSIFLEGFSRPEGGIKPMLDLLRRRYLDLGGELRMKSGVARILTAGGTARGVVLEDGTELLAERVISSAGWVETMELCGQREVRVPPEEEGRLTFVESISVLDREPEALGFGAATAFFNRTDKLRYERPDELVDFDSGVLSSPNNYAAETPPPEGVMRLTILANYERWTALDEPEYARRKEQLAREAIAGLAGFFPDWNPHTVFRDVFTPRTIHRFTGHRQGAVYGSPRKRRDGVTGIDGLYLCGTDQGFLGVIGALVGGIGIANRHALVPTASA